MENAKNDNSQALKLSAEIKKTWSKLSDEEVGFQATAPDKFYEAVKTKYSVNKDEAEKTVKKLTAECGATDTKDASAPAKKSATA